MTTSAGQPTPTPDLAGLLSRRPATTKKVPAAEPAESTALSSAAEPAAQARLAAVPPVTTTSRAPQRQYLRSITVYLPRNLFIALGVAASERGTSRTALMLTAVNATHDQLGGVLNPLRADRSDLFDVPQNRKAAGEPSVQTTMRVTDTQLDALSTLVQRHNAARSHVIAAAVEMYINNS